MYKILKIEGDTILLGDEDKKILTVNCNNKLNIDN